MGERIYRVSLARAQATIGAAVEANRKYKIQLPKEYVEARHLVERWVLHPPAAALNADTTRDELENLPLAVEHPEQPLVLNEHDLQNPAVQQWLAQQDESEPEEAIPPEEEEKELQDILSRAHYPPPVERLLSLGEPQGTEWRDYTKEGIKPEHIPHLIRMATDRELNRALGTSNIVWAPVHAWRALGQLRAAEAAEPLTGLLRYIDQDNDDWIGEEIPQVLGMIGPAALPALDAYLADGRNPLWASVATAQAIWKIGKDHAPARPECVASLTRALERFSQNDPTLNAELVLGLVELRAVEAADLIERAFTANRVDESVMGDWEEVQIELGLRTARTKPRRAGWLEPFHRKR